MINLIIVAIILIIAITFAIFRPGTENNSQVSRTPPAQTNSLNPDQATIAQTANFLNNDPQPSPDQKPQKRLVVEPVRNFYERITKKPFGIYITPETSPVQPDKFTGYHTGVDIEYDDVIREIPVKAIADGTVIISRFASGYGGVVMVRYNIDGEPIIALYGHLDTASMPKQGTAVRQGNTIGVLGEGHSEETDGARKHLHFSILKKKSVDLRGYVHNKEDLEGWHDPLEFFASL